MSTYLFKLRSAELGETQQHLLVWALTVLAFLSHFLAQRHPGWGKFQRWFGEFREQVVGWVFRVGIALGLNHSAARQAWSIAIQHKGDEGKLVCLPLSPEAARQMCAESTQALDTTPHSCYVIIHTPRRGER